MQEKREKMDEILNSCGDIWFIQEFFPSKSCRAIGQTSVRICGNGLLLYSHALYENV
jgi:hypothetical protein